MTDTFVSLAVETSHDDIRLRRSRAIPREATTDTAASEALSLLVEMADETFDHYGFTPVIAQALAVGSLLSGTGEVHPAAEGDLVDAVRELQARVAWAEDPANWTASDDLNDSLHVTLTLAPRPDAWTPPEAAEPEPAPQWYDDLPFVTPEVRQILSGAIDLSDPESLAELGEHSLRVAGQLGRQSLRATFEQGAPEPGPQVRAVRRVDQLAAEPPLDVLYVRHTSTGEWEAQGIDGDTYRYRWTDFTAFGEVVDCSDEHRYGVRQPMPGQVVVVDLAKAREGADSSSFEVEDVGEAWRVVNELHAAAAPPQILARRAEQKEEGKNQ
jgi:hypothetical protein